MNTVECIVYTGTYISIYRCMNFVELSRTGTSQGNTKQLVLHTDVPLASYYKELKAYCFTDNKEAIIS